MAEEAGKPVVSSPPVAAQPAREEGNEARMRLHLIAKELVRQPNRRLLIEFLQLRRRCR
jgi:hypothetical protein